MQQTLSANGACTIFARVKDFVPPLAVAVYTLPDTAFRDATKSFPM